MTELCELFELRQYTLHPGRRDELIALFDAHFVESQAEAGMRVYGQFRDLDDPDRFVWLRGFPEAARRAEALAAFYERHPAWRTHREAANATMLDSDDVLLLEPVTGGLAAARAAGAGVAGAAGGGTATPETAGAGGGGTAPPGAAARSGGGAAPPAVARVSGGAGTAAPKIVDSHGDGAAPPGAEARSGGGAAPPPVARGSGRAGTAAPEMVDSHGYVAVPPGAAARSGGGDAAPPGASAVSARAPADSRSSGEGRLSSVHREPAVFEVVICYPEDLGAFPAFFRQELVPTLTAAGAPPLASFRTSSRRNDYPRLPVREGEHVFVWLTRSPAPVELPPIGRRAPQRLRLAPTPGSWLR